ncbi:hypothetical protein DFA_09304 [Cavenderia fasciculata]|uniref:Uncharacterized protein n=1 Tax=Cavenderia fasciculata TaxID=261658 RepID=F4Q792_CACFS|nr:uncharacterized protein DFA_09304 [Cavenderia fasciculata]EGG16274.1 hypothetical protein DFA_09304 [Cavenderia fasciculata]|eukprot:XP_004354658.1 hypothetical protein DFA_09304 [Cavenderia fasciculata]
MTDNTSSNSIISMSSKDRIIKSVICNKYLLFTKIVPSIKEIHDKILRFENSGASQSSNTTSSSSSTSFSLNFDLNAHTSVASSVINNHTLSRRHRYNDYISAEWMFLNNYKQLFLSKLKRFGVKGINLTIPALDHLPRLFGQSRQEFDEILELLGLAGQYQFFHSWRVYRTLVASPSKELTYLLRPTDAYLGGNDADLRQCLSDVMHHGNIGMLKEIMSILPPSYKIPMSQAETEKPVRYDLECLNHVIKEGRHNIKSRSYWTMQGSLDLMIVAERNKLIREDWFSSLECALASGNKEIVDWTLAKMTKEGRDGYDSYNVHRSFELLDMACLNNEYEMIRYAYEKFPKTWMKKYPLSISQKSIELAIVNRYFEILELTDDMHLCTPKMVNFATGEDRGDVALYIYTRAKSAKRQNSDTKTISALKPDHFSDRLYKYRQSINLFDIIRSKSLELVKGFRKEYPNCFGNDRVRSDIIKEIIKYECFDILQWMINDIKVVLSTADFYLAVRYRGLNFCILIYNSLVQQSSKPLAAFKKTVITKYFYQNVLLNKNRDVINWAIQLDVKSFNNSCLTLDSCTELELQLQFQQQSQQQPTDNNNENDNNDSDSLTAIEKIELYLLSQNVIIEPEQEIEIDDWQSMFDEPYY